MGQRIVMISISEWLPNPKGKDAGNEWVELFNDAPYPVSLSGWVLHNGKKDTTILSGVVPAKEFFLIRGSALKTTLRNTDESLFLYDSQGRLVSESRYLGSAQEGKSVVTQGSTSFFSDPTPGAPNGNAQTALLVSHYPASGHIAHDLGYGEVIVLSLGSGLIIALCVTIACIYYASLRELFFGRDPEIR